MIRGLFNKAGLSSESFMPCSLEADDLDDVFGKMCLGYAW
jgi:hypothetical protein